MTDHSIFIVNLIFNKPTVLLAYMTNLVHWMFALLNSNMLKIYESRALQKKYSLK